MDEKDSLVYGEAERKHLHLKRAGVGRGELERWWNEIEGSFR